METRTRPKEKRTRRARFKSFVPGRNAKHRNRGIVIMEYKDLSNTEKYIYDLVNNDLSRLSKSEINNILEVLRNTYKMKGGLK